MSNSIRSTLLILLAITIAAIPGTQIWAQGWAPQQNSGTGAGTAPPPPLPSPRWEGHAIALGANIALGAITAGVTRAIKGEPFWSAIGKGGAGAGIAYLGKYVATQDFTGAKLLGRQTAALGASVTYNAVTGRGIFETLTFPLGPVRIHRTPEGSRVTIDLLTAAGIFYAYTRPGGMIDLPRTVATGTIVVLADSIRRGEGGAGVVGRTVGGVIIYRTGHEISEEMEEAILRHEMVHVLQHDYAGITIGSPFEGWLIGKMPEDVAERLRDFDFGTYALLKLVPFALGIRGRDVPWEREAYFLVDEAERIWNAQVMVR